MNLNQCDNEKEIEKKKWDIIHYTYKLKTASQSQNKIYFSRLRGYRDRK